MPLKFLSLEEVASRREWGLCFNCDKRFHRGHKCASHVFLLIADEEEVILEDPVEMDQPLDPPDINNTVLA